MNCPTCDLEVATKNGRYQTHGHIATGVCPSSDTPVDGTLTHDAITRTLDLITTLANDKVEQGATPEEAIAFATSYALTRMRGRQELFALLGEELSRARENA